MNTRTVIILLGALALIPIPLIASAFNWEGAFDYQVTTDDPLLVKDVEPTIAVQATNPNNVVAGNYVFDYPGGGHNCQIYQSTNGGTGWSHKKDFDRHSGSSNVFDPVITSANNGNLYDVCIEKDPAGPTYYLKLETSTDGGANWAVSDAVGPTISQLDKPWVTADDWSSSPYKNNVYACWTDFSTVQIMFKRIVPMDPDSAAVSLGVGQFCNIAIGPQGQVYVAYTRMFGPIGQNAGGDTVITRNFSGGNPSNWYPIQVLGAWNSLPASQDCSVSGVTFECVKGFNNVNYRVSHIASLATDSNGGIHGTWMTYSAATGTLTDILYTNSATCKSANDGCGGWHTDITVNLDTGASDQFEPSIAISKTNNVIHITAYDKRQDSGNIYYKAYDYTCHYNPPTNDCSKQSEWSNTPVASTTTANLDQSTFIDDYHGVATSSSREAYTDWTDHRDTYASDYDIWANRSEKGLEIAATEQSTGAAINGLNVVVLDPSGTQVANGFTPLYYLPTTTGTYTVRFNNYGTYFASSTPPATYVTDYKIYSWGEEVKVNVANTNDEFRVDGIYFNSANSGHYGKITINSARTDGSTLTGMYVSVKDLNGVLLTKGYTPFTIGLPTSGTTYLTLAWNNFGTTYYQYGDPSANASEITDVRTNWGGQQQITLPTDGATYTDTGKYASSPPPPP